jgi:hypothetical protein
MSHDSEEINPPDPAGFFVSSMSKLAVKARLLSHGYFTWEQNLQ